MYRNVLYFCLFYSDPTTESKKTNVTAADDANEVEETDALAPEKVTTEQSNCFLLH